MKIKHLLNWKERGKVLHLILDIYEGDWRCLELKSRLNTHCNNLIVPYFTKFSSCCKQTLIPMIKTLQGLKSNLISSSRPIGILNLKACPTDFLQKSFMFTDITAFWSTVYYAIIDRNKFKCCTYIAKR